MKNCIVNLKAGLVPYAMWRGGEEERSHGTWEAVGFHPRVAAI